jgi:hypothetical protein
VKAMHRLSASDRNLSQEAFLTAQLAQSSKAAASVSQMSARSAKDEGKLGPLIRERQDLVAEWQALDQAHTLAMARTADKRDAKFEADNVARLKAIDARVSEIDNALAKDFPEYAAPTSTQPLDIPAVQAQLRADEALAGC